MRNSLIGILRTYLLFTLAGTLYIFGRFQYHADELFYYHCIILALGTILAIFSLRSSVSNDDQYSKSWTPVITMVLGAVFFSYNTWQSYSDVNFWLDEYSQIMNSRGDIFLFSASEQQPAGGYILSGLIGEIVGFGKMSAKLMGFVPMLISLIIFQLAFIRTRGFVFFSILLSLFYTFDFDVRYLSLEGRPVGLAMMTLSFCALSFKLYLQDNIKRNLFSFALCTYLFFFSVGMQPIFLMFCFGLACMILLAVDNKRYRECMWIGIALLLPALLFLPIQLYIFEAAQGAGQIKVDAGHAFNKWLEGWSLKNYITFFYSRRGSGLWALSVFLSGFVLALKNVRQRSVVFKTLFIGLLIWVPSFEFFYKVIVAWQLQRWYFTCFYVLATIFALRLICREGTLWLKAAVGSLALFLCLFGDTSIRYKEKVSFRRDWEGLHEKLIKDYGPDKVYVFGMCDFESFWCWDVFVGAGIFGHEQQDSRFRVYGEGVKQPFGSVPDNGIVFDTVNAEEDIQISAIIPSEKSVCPSHLVSRDVNIECKFWNRFTIISTKEKINLKKHGGKFLEYLYETEDFFGSRFFINSLLVSFYHAVGDREKVLKWFDTLKTNTKILRKIKKGYRGNQFIRDMEKLVGKELNS